MKRFLLIVLILFFASSCSDSGGDSSDDSDSGSTHTVDFILYSSDGNMPQGRKVVYLYAFCEDGSACTQPGTPFQACEAIVETEGQVNITVAHDYQGYFWTSFYIDVDNSSTLTAGDLVWGTDPDKIFGGIIEFPATRTYSGTDQTWELLANSEFGGYSTYAGTAREWSTGQ